MLIAERVITVRVPSVKKKKKNTRGANGFLFRSLCIGARIRGTRRVGNAFYYHVRQSLWWW